MFWQGTLMKSSWQCYFPVWGDVTVRIQHGFEDHTVPSTFQYVMFHSLYSQWPVCKSRVGAGCPWVTSQGALSSFHIGTLSLLCKALFSSWLLPPSRAGPHLISWPGRESVQISKLGSGAPRDQMDKVQWTPKPHLLRGASSSCPSSLVIANGRMGSVVPELLILTSRK